MIDYNVVCQNNNNLTQAELMSQIQDYNFAITDLALYLDTHPFDQKAVALHNEYCKTYRNYVDQYERMYGPLSIFCPVGSWKWIQNTWPWEGGTNN